MEKKGGIGIIMLVIIILGGLIVGGYFLFSGNSLGKVDMSKLSVSTETLIIEEDIGNLKYIKTGDDGSEAVFLKARNTNDEVNKELDSYTIYSGIYKNKKHFPEGNYGWSDYRINVMIQDYKETISNNELNIFLDAKVLHDSYSKKIIGKQQIYVINKGISKMFLWKSSDKLIIVYPSTGAKENYSEEEMVFLAEIYLNFYPLN